MGKAWIVTGLAFGDEGKGTIVDALARRIQDHSDCDVTVVRHNGGCQASHAVTVGGKTHRFHSFGSGTLAGARTILSRFFLFNPLYLWEEAKELDTVKPGRMLNTVTVDPDALVTTPYHIAIGQLRELINNHGSCGLGIGATMQHSIDFPDETVRVRDLLDKGTFCSKLFRVMLWAQQEWLGMTALLQSENAKVVAAAGLLFDTQEFDACVDVYCDVLRMCHVQSSGSAICDALKKGDVIFEGAQGILLDQDWGFHPHTTWSNCTTENARTLIAEAGGAEIVSIGVTRAYAARHGAGPFPNWFILRQSDPVDLHNPPNDWQGAMRFGVLDIPLLRYAVSVSGGIDYLALTCIDHWPSAARIPIMVGEDLPAGSRGNLIHSEEIGKGIEASKRKLACLSHRDLGSSLADHIGLQSKQCIVGSYGPEATDKSWSPHLANLFSIPAGVAS